MDRRVEKQNLALNSCFGHPWSKPVHFL